MRSADQTIVAAALLCSAVLGQPAFGELLPVYDVRDVLKRPEITGSLNNKVRTAPGRLIEMFNAIKIEQSLMIHQCGEWCSDARLSFASTLQMAGEVMGMPGPGRSLASWRASAGPDKLPADFTAAWTSPPAPPLHLLAVVNRLDLATWDNPTRTWVGAEVRLVFGANYANSGFSLPRKVTVIAEFRLRPLTWGQMKAEATRWHQLDSAVPDANHIAAVLAGIRSATGFDLVRIRSNAQHKIGLWHLHQWELTPGAAAWQRVNLDDEVNPDCFERPGCRPFYQIWDELVANPSLVRHAVPAQLPSKPYGESSAPMPVIFGRKQTRPRNVLGLQQCSSCHRKETATNFNHVENRSPGSTEAGLSSFLTGNEINATFAQLSPTDTSVRSTTVVDITCKSPPCDGPMRIERHFHDLGRRRLYMAAVLAASPAFSPADVELIMNYATDFSH